MASLMSFRTISRSLPLDAVGGVAQHQVAVAVLAGDLERGLVVARAAPAGELFVLSIWRGSKEEMSRRSGGAARSSMRHRGAPQYRWRSAPSAPIPMA
jgi:hypothetical protein